MLQLFSEAVVEPVVLAEAGGLICIRLADVSDVESLSVYFTGLSTTSRNRRFMGARADLAVVAAECVPKEDQPERFTLLAELSQDGQRTIVGETQYAYDGTAQHGEFAISVADSFRRIGLGWQMIAAMEARAIDLGHATIAGETARTNAEMRGLAAKAGFRDTGLGDWQSVHLAKHLPHRR